MRHFFVPRGWQPWYEISLARRRSAEAAVVCPEFPDGQCHEIEKIEALVSFTSLSFIKDYSPPLLLALFFGLICGNNSLTAERDSIRRRLQGGKGEFCQVTMCRSSCNWPDPRLPLSSSVSPSSTGSGTSSRRPAYATIPSTTRSGPATAAIIMECAP